MFPDAALLLEPNRNPDPVFKLPVEEEEPKADFDWVFPKRPLPLVDEAPNIRLGIEEIRIDKRLMNA